MNAATNDAAPGRPHRALHDLVAGHFDGGLSPAEQRHLAERLDASPEARRVLARFLRLEAATIRLAAAGLLPSAGAAAAVAAGAAPPAPGPRSPAVETSSDERRPAGVRDRRLRPAPAAIAGGLLAAMATVAAVAILPRGVLPSRPEGARGDIGTVADHWIELRRAAEPAAVAMAEPAADTARDADATGPDSLAADSLAADSPAPGAQPTGDPPTPAWLLAAVADEAAAPPTPDAGRGPPAAAGG